MSKRTPGPWKVNPEGTVVWLNGSAGYELRDPTGFGHKANPADARLIAAAPDLLEAAIEARQELCAVAYIIEQGIEVVSLQSVKETITTLRAAIAKAEGEEV